MHFKYKVLFLTVTSKINHTSAVTTAIKNGNFRNHLILIL